MGKISSVQHAQACNSPSCQSQECGGLFVAVVRTLIYIFCERVSPCGLVGSSSD